MSLAQRVTAKIGPYTVTSETGDVPTPGVLQLADNWTVTEQLGDDQLWPQQPTETATMTVYAGTADDIAGIIEGARVQIKYPTLSQNQTFEGRVTDAVVRAHPLGVVADVVAIDRRHADLSELLVGDAPWPAEPIQARMARIMAAIGVPYQHMELGVSTSWGTYPGSNPNVAARDVDSQPALGLIERLLDSWVVDYTATNLIGGGVKNYGLRRHWLRPVLSVGSGALLQWETYSVAVQLDSQADLPGEFGDTTADGWPGYGVTIPVDPTMREVGVVDAAYVDLSSAAFSQKRGKAPNQVAIKWLNAGVEATATTWNGKLPVSTFRLETELTQSAAAARAAALYLPDAASTDWYADAFTWRWYADEWAHGEEFPRVGDPVIVAPVQDRHSPIGRPWYNGILTSRVAKLSKGQPVIEVTVKPQIRPQLPGTPSEGLKWDGVAAGVTWNDLNARDTWDDYRLLRT